MKRFLPSPLLSLAVLVLWLLLVGDSAGMISPFNGEGISYAM